MRWLVFCHCLPDFYANDLNEGLSIGIIKHNAFIVFIFEFDSSPLSSSLHFAAASIRVGVWNESGFLARGFQRDLNRNIKAIYIHKFTQRTHMFRTNASNENERREKKDTQTYASICAHRVLSKRFWCNLFNIMPCVKFFFLVSSFTLKNTLLAWHTLTHKHEQLNIKSIVIRWYTHCSTWIFAHFVIDISNKINSLARFLHSWHSLLFSSLPSVLMHEISFIVIHHIHRGIKNAHEFA